MPLPRAIFNRAGCPRAQAGATLLEALVAILIFSLGILGTVGLQAIAVQQSTEARNRTDATQLVDRLIGLMWTSNRTVANLQTQFNDCTTPGSCTGYTGWYEEVARTLPGVTLTGTTKPTVNVDANGLVTISVFWRAPTDPVDSRHRYDSEAQIQQ